jgi:ankyrin repeat protein
MKATNNKPISKTRLLTLIKELDWRSVKAALESNPELLRYRGDRGQNLLHVCCGLDIDGRGTSAASIKTAGVLLDAGLDINKEAFTEGEWKATPLWYAISRGKNLALAKYLLSRGSSPEHTLWAAAFNDDPVAVRLLVKAGAVVDAPGPETAFLFAIKWSHFTAAKVLLEAGADANSKDRLGKTALHYMVKKRSDPDHMRMVLKHGARLDLKDRDGVTVGSLLSRARTPEYRALAEKYS